MDVISEHISTHVFIRNLIDANCGIDIPITASSLNKVMEDGTGQGMVYKITCPESNIPSIRDFTITFSPTTKRENGEEMSCEEIESYSVVVKDGEVKTNACDKDGLCSEYTDEVLIF